MRHLPKELVSLCLAELLMAALDLEREKTQNNFRFHLHIKKMSGMKGAVFERCHKT